jgi:hypothetical protein
MRINKFQKLVKKFNDTFDSHNSKIESSDKIISEHCQMIRARVDTRTQSLI